MLYTNPNSYAHFDLTASLSIADDSPKSSFTLPPLLSLPSVDSEADLPRNSQLVDRAKPCCGRLEVAWFGGGGPKT
jgi:hypothetical protein